MNRPHHNSNKVELEHLTRTVGNSSFMEMINQNHSGSSSHRHKIYCEMLSQPPALWSLSDQLAALNFDLFVLYYLLERKVCKVNQECTVSQLWVSVQMDYQNILSQASKTII